MMQDEINNELRELGSGLADGNRGMPHGIPAGYFDALSKKMADMAMESDAEARLPRVDMPYKAPIGYFEALPGRMLELVGAKTKKGILISFGQIRWAAAAMLFIMVGIGTYRVFYANERPVYQNELLASVDDGDIQEYLGEAGHVHAGQQESIAMDKMEVTQADIVGYLDETGWDNEY